MPLSLPLRVLCIDDDPDFLIAIKMDLRTFCSSECASSLKDGLKMLKESAFDVVFLDIDLGSEDGIEGLRAIKREDPSIEVVMVTGLSEPKYVIEAIKGGAADYLTKPLSSDAIGLLLEKISRSHKIKERHDALIEVMGEEGRSCNRMIGISSSFGELLAKIDRLKGHDANVLIEGESGTGKELVARRIHVIESDVKRPFVAVNCAAIPEALIESELFGHERGSFTGAVSKRIGKFEIASGGDIFLDEICALKLEMQQKLLRALQEQEISRIGGGQPIKINFRVIAATNEDIESMVASGRFRLDLFHRLKVVGLKVPPLRERVEDIPLLVRYFLEKYSRKGTKKEFAPTALDFMMKYSWPGNVRELENLVHNLVIMVPGKMIEGTELPERMRAKQACSSGNESTQTLDECLMDVERDYISKLLADVDGNKTKAATRLGWSRTTLHNRIKALGM